MTNASNRGTAPGRARDASQRPGSFKPGHKKLGGRKKGTPNALSVDYKNAVTAAAYFVGRDGKGAGGLVGYFTRLLIECPDVGLMLLARAFLYDDGWPPDDRILSEEQNDKEVRHSLGATGSGRPDPALTTQFPIPELMRIAIKHPKVFGKLFAAMVPVPRGRPRRPSRDAMASECNQRLEFLRRCALLLSEARKAHVSVEPRGDAAFPSCAPHPNEQLSN